MEFRCMVLFATRKKPPQRAGVFITGSAGNP